MEGEYSNGSAESFITKEVSQICSLIATHIQEAAMMCGDKSPISAVFSPSLEPSLEDGMRGLSLSPPPPPCEFK